ncbi:MAG TPA: hypothetical protein VFB30_21145 [Spirochaetia bacterium]|nr:hypothetical protein [Spirochaetia bacterium]
MREKKTGDFVGAVVVNVLVCIVLNTLLLWRQWTQGVILESWVDILWAANISFAVQIGGNLILAFYHPPRLQSLMRALFAAAGLLSAIVFFIVFPMDFSHLVGTWLNTLLKVLLMIGIGVSLITFVVEFVRFIVGTPMAPGRTET